MSHIREREPRAYQRLLKAEQEMSQAREERDRLAAKHTAFYTPGGVFNRDPKPLDINGIMEMEQTEANKTARNTAYEQAFDDWKNSPVTRQ